MLPTTTFGYFITELKRVAAIYNVESHYYSYEELSADEKKEIKAQYDTASQFEFINKFQLKAQLDDYETAYMGENVKAGDILWFDGKYFCSRYTVEQCLNQEFIDSAGQRLSWVDCAKIVAKTITLAEFDIINESYNSKTAKKKQILWLVNYIKEHKQSNPRHFSIDAYNVDIEEDFHHQFGFTLSHRLWVSRIREAATHARLRGWRNYIADASPSAGIPRYIMSYS